MRLAVNWIFFSTEQDLSDDEDCYEEPLTIKSSSQSKLLECYKHLLVSDSPVSRDSELHVSEVKPTYKQFQNFFTFISTLEKQGHHQPGMVKVGLIETHEQI